MNKKYEDIDAEEDSELEHYVDELEEQSHREILPGRGEARSLRGTIESVYMQHRPLLWYMVSELR